MDKKAKSKKATVKKKISVRPPVKKSQARKTSSRVLSTMQRVVEEIHNKNQKMRNDLIDSMASDLSKKIQEAVRLAALDRDMERFVEWGIGSHWDAYNVIEEATNSGARKAISWLRLQGQNINL